MKLSLQIDKDVIKQMTDEELSRYIPCHGDRLAIVNFMKSPINKRKQTLLDRLRKKIKSKQLQSSETDSDSDKDKNAQKGLTRKRKLIGNENAKKEYRRIDIGWIIKDENGTKQVRTKQGGGTRKIKMKKDSTKKDILEEAIKIFFKDKMSSKGCFNDFEFDVWDYSENPLAEDITLGELYESSKLGIFRVYLISTPKKKTADCQKDNLSNVHVINLATEANNTSVYNSVDILEEAAKSSGIDVYLDDLPDPFLLDTNVVEIETSPRDIENSVSNENTSIMSDTSGTVQIGPFSPELNDLDETLPYMEVPTRTVSLMDRGFDSVHNLSFEP